MTSVFEKFVFFLFFSPTTLLGTVALLVLYLVSSSFTFQKKWMEPPGPRPLPLLGNLLQFDLKRPHKTLYELSKKYGSVFTVYFGTNKVVVLAEYKTVKEALVSNAEEFGDGDSSPIFYDTNQGHGILFGNGESWKEMRRFALTSSKCLKSIKNKTAEQDIVPLAIPHKTSKDITFQGYFIKEGTTVFPLLISVLHGESEWESPHTFNPSHFLDKEGRRVCLGESLAKMELFLFFTSLLRHFRFTPPPGVTVDELDLSPAVGFTLPPSAHELCAISRQ